MIWYIWYICIWSDIYDMIYLLTAIGLTPGGSGTVHIDTQTVHRTAQWKQNTQNGTYITLRIRKHNNEKYIKITIKIHNLLN